MPAPAHFGIAQARRSRPFEISGSHPSCTYQETGSGTECDESQFSYPEVAPNGTVYVHFINYQNETAWEVDFGFDGQIMVVKSTAGGAPGTWSAPGHALLDPPHDRLPTAGTCRTRCTPGADPAPGVGP